MIRVGTNAVQRALEAQLLVAHRIRVNVAVHNRDEQVIKSLPAALVVSGAVQVDATADVTHALQLELLDPAHKMQFDNDSPAAGALFADNFISVEYGVWVDALEDWVDVPVFWGPLTKFTRSGPVCIIEAQGKETLALDPHFVTRNYTLNKGKTVAAAIRDVMDRLGENRYSLSAVLGQLHRGRGVAEGEAPWQVLVGGSTDGNGKPKPSLMQRARGNMYLFYNGAGRLTAKKRDARPTWSFDHRSVITRPTFEFDILTARNHAEVKGGKRKHGTGHYRGTATLGATHPLNPSRLGRNSKPRLMTIFREAENLKSDAACRRKAEALLAGGETVAASFDSLPVPHLEPFDKCRLEMDGYDIVFTVKQFTIPLTSDAAMSIGYNKTFKPRARRRKRKGKG